MNEPKISKKQQAHVNKYINKAYDRINLTVPKGQRAVLQEHADQMGDKSVNGFIQRAIKETMERDQNGEN